tara:strand:- start:272 stop:496 length:225 start_codon:yes stop_codon:yes gene_type:complete
MNEILLDFEKLLATIKNPKNNIIHLDNIYKMIIFYENKHRFKYRLQNNLLVFYLHKQLQKQVSKLSLDEPDKII